MPFDTPATENAQQHATKLMKRYLVKPFWVLIVPFLFPSVLAAEPSLAETVQYIEAKLSADGGYQETFRQIGQNITYRKRNEDNTWGETYTFQLGALSTTVEVKERSGTMLAVITVSCARGACISKREFHVYRGEREEKSLSVGGMSFTVDTNTDARKLQKALTHAIKLSGGKDELF